MAKLIVIMGPAGCGKSVVAARIAAARSATALDADDFHSRENIAHMAGGNPLTDAQREPWIAAMEKELHARLGNNENIVLAYSGLRRAHRARIRACAQRSLFIKLQVPIAQLQERVAKRQNHFMSAQMLPSQLAAMESPASEETIVQIAAHGSLDDVVESTLNAIRETFS
ncbi:gluconokinase [Halioglobus maricola]|uniref:Gluconokinase n=1 Tax=Halioglobus maricola TaxID=2601894 RepID=A0A5P9NPC7_9GAMM|nr:gluconokinase, GntK/IdnK-type [Halioglobus maricola]QFU77346.1 gluconokinase [Halioglobus maricola]